MGISPLFFFKYKSEREFLSFIFGNLIYTLALGKLGENFCDIHRGKKVPIKLHQMSKLA